MKVTCTNCGHNSPYARTQETETLVNNPCPKCSTIGKMKVDRSDSTRRPNSLGNLILEILKEKGKVHGLAIDQALEFRGKTVGLGKLYTTLHNLEKKGLIRSEWKDEPDELSGYGRRRYYELTDYTDKFKQ